MQAARAFTLKNYPRAIERLSDLLALVGENPHTLYFLALCHSRQNDDLQALAFARRALVADPGHLESLKLLGHMHFLRGEHREARDYVKRALDLQRAAEKFPASRTSSRTTPPRTGCWPSSCPRTRWRRYF